jgi:hypothetical protein
MGVGVEEAFALPFPFGMGLQLIEKRGGQDEYLSLRVHVTLILHRTNRRGELGRRLHCGLGSTNFLDGPESLP